MKLKKLLVFANDPLKEYYKKGELVDRYFNPGDFFDEVYFISLTEDEIEKEKIQYTVGNAKLKIYTINKIGPWIFLPLSKFRKKILEIAEEIQPDCVRAYNAHVHGFLASIVSSKLNIPLAVSLHINTEKDIRSFLNPFSHPYKWLFWKFNKYITEPFVLNRADKIICVYKFIYDFAKGICRDGNKIELIYNRIDMEQFSPIDKSMVAAGFNLQIIKAGRAIRILCVGRLFEQKNPENLIRAMSSVNAELTIIGDGPYREKMQKIIETLNLGNKVFMIASVSNKEIHRYYQEADIFVSVNDYGGISKVVIEAMASGLPIVVNKKLWGPPELLEDTAIIIENSSEGFTKTLNKLIANPALRDKLGKRNWEKALEIDGRIMEQKEVEVYRDLVDKK